MQATPAILEATLASLDHIRELINDPQLSTPGNAARHAALLNEIRSLCSETDVTKVETTPQQEGNSTYYVFCKPSRGIFTNGTNPLYLIDDLVSLGQTWVMPCLNEIPTLESFESNGCYTAFEIILATSQPVENIREVFLFVEDSCEINITKLASNNLFSNPTFADKLSTIEPFVAPRGHQAFVGFATIAEKEVVRNIEVTTARERKEASTIRVSSEKLDELMNLVSELVTSQARLSLLTEQHGLPDLTVVSETMEKLTRRLRDNAFTICLVPIESLVVRFQRLVRDLSKELDKEIEFIAEGTETELDRSIIEKVTDPILHILRNAIDHGIESKQIRAAHKKDVKGRITFKAYHSGTNVFIQISDDGKGIDVSTIRRKAVEKGIISPDVELRDEEILNLIFAPGFSTAEKISDVSGRGVGMDIVKRNIESIHGEVSVESEVGVGTVMTIKLPLTLSILDGMLVEIGKSKYLLPLSAIQTCYEIESARVSADVAQKKQDNSGDQNQLRSISCWHCGRWYYW
jgi:two-component system, chemotaxis family, sensor kinase CheA